MTSEVTKLESVKYKFIKYIADPERGTLDEFAKANNCSRRQLARWKKQPDFRDLVIQEVESNLFDAVPDVYSVIKKRAKQGDFQFVKLFMEQMELLKELKQDQPTNNIMIQILNDLRENDQEGDKEPRHIVEGEDTREG